ncbi:MAG: hypothetical protein KC492_26045 [Myxococcales bacterium]|nr:hypothetical protein [Myxococcales bacterium]MCB9605482.1 hypothetical protein [Polyangiaceae bacterium]
MTRKNRIIALSVLLFGALAGTAAVASADPASPAPAAAADKTPAKGKARKGHKRGTPAQHLARVFAKFDTNKDGKLTEGEVPERAWNRLSKADANGDKAVTKAELKAKMAEMKAKHAERKGKRGEGKGKRGEGKGKRGEGKQRGAAKRGPSQG